MMIPSIVRNDRSLFAEMAWSATWMISRISMAASPRPAAAARRWALLLHPGDPAPTGHPLDSLAHLLLRCDEGRAREHEDGIVLGETVGDLDDVEVREAGMDLDRLGLSAAEREDDVASRLAAGSGERLA